MGEVTASGSGALRQDAVAVVPGAIASVPDGMASAVVVGVNPVYGLRPEALFVLSVLAGVIMIIAGVQTAYNAAEEWLGVHAG